MFNILKSTRNASNVTTHAVQKISEVNLVGRDYVCPRNLTPCELKSLLWTALDLKHLSKEKSNNIPLLKASNVAVILDKSSIYTQVPIKLGSDFLGAKTTTIIDRKWKNDNPYIGDFGRLLAITSDIIFCQIKEQKILEQVADGANVPVVGISSCKYNIIKALADIMTIYENFCRIKYLSVAWIGQSEPLFHTYLLVLPQLKINLKYCLVDGKCDDNIIEEARKYSQIFNTEIHELRETREATHRTNVVVTSAHDVPEFEINLEHMNDAAINWAFLHSLPRGVSEVKTEVFAHKNSLVWKSFDNLRWIYAALMVRFLTHHKHSIPEPTYDSDEYSIK